MTYSGRLGSNLLSLHRVLIYQSDSIRGADQKNRGFGDENIGEEAKSRVSGEYRASIDILQF